MSFFIGAVRSCLGVQESKGYIILGSEVFFCLCIYTFISQSSSRVGLEAFSEAAMGSIFAWNITKYTRMSQISDRIKLTFKHQHNYLQSGVYFVSFPRLSPLVLGKPAGSPGPLGADGNETSVYYFSPRQDVYLF